MKKLIIIIAFFSSVITCFAQADLQQKLKGYVNPEELVTLSQNISYDQAIQVLSKVSEKISGKRIVSTVNVSDPIGLELERMPYKKALMIIVRGAGLMTEETESTIIIKRPDTSKEQLAKDVYASVDEREVKISAVLFEVNVTESRERGINWEFLLSRSGLSLGTKFITLQEEQQQSSGSGAALQQKPPTMDLEAASAFTTGKFDGTSSSLIRFFESENLGQVIARQSIITRNGIKGRNQVGTDISIKERDFSGNLIDRFYSTGTIIEVTPHIYNEDGIDYVLLQLAVERSSAQPDVISTQINKTQAITSVLMLDSEETAIGGLFVNEETNVRRGIPFFKDLPWWVLGLRYLTGYDQKQVVQKEIIMLVKTEIAPSLKERISKKKEENLINKERDQNKQVLEKYRIDPEKKDENNKN